MTDFGVAANVKWFAKWPAEGQIEGGETQHFSRLDEAVRFVMEDISEVQRSSAWITTDDSAFEFEKIVAMYGEIPKQNGD